MLSALLVTACGSTQNGQQGKATCDEIGEICHDATSAAGQACHENAHDVWTEAECVAEKAGCLAACQGVQADAGPTVDAGGAPDAS
jgi:hypothetical protein